MELNIAAFRDRRENPWNGRDRVLHVARENVFETYHSAADLALDRELGGRYLEQGFAERSVAEAEARFAAHWRFFRELERVDAKRLPDEGLWRWFRRAFDGWEESIGHFRASQAEGTEALLAKLQAVCTPAEIATLLTPPALDIAGQERQDWARIDGSDRSLLDHARKYPWTVMCHFTEEEMLRTLRRRLESDKGDHGTAAYEEVAAAQECILARHPGIAPAVRTLQRLAQSRMEIKSCWAGTDFYLLPLVAELSRRRGESARGIMQHYLPDEIRALALEGERLPSAEKARRDRCFVGLWKDGKATYASGEEAEAIVRRELGEQRTAGGPLSGTGANPGKARGRVRIVIANDIPQNEEARKRFREGDILVTQMTQPSLMDIASKAGAMVTDEGGMLSHAAIISRELRIPCVVGTKRATKAFRDGDLVEVDAGKGVVRKL